MDTNTTPLRAIIIDDEQKGITTLRSLIGRFTEDIKVVAESRKPAEAIELIENYKPEILFLDINMPGMDGFQMLEKLKWKNFKLIFVTAHHEHALKALKNNAVEYLLKPIDYKELQVAIHKVKVRMESEEAIFSMNVYARLIQELNQQNKSRVLVHLRSGIEHINASEIIFLEAITNYTRLHLGSSRSVLSSKTLKEYEDYLCNGQFNFMRVHKSFVINLGKIVRYMKVENVIVMKDESKVPLGKSRRDDFFTWLDIN